MSTRRPQVAASPSSTTGARGVLVILRRELAAKFFTRAFAFGTALFAVMMLAAPLISGGDDGGGKAKVVGYTSATAPAAAALDRAGGQLITTKQVDGEPAGRGALTDGSIDVLLLPGAQDGYRALVDDGLDAGTTALLSRVLIDDSVRSTALRNGVTQAQLSQAQRDGTVSVVPLNDGLDIAAVMLGLAFPVAAVLIVFLWAVPLATDVMQEKVSRVVEILLTSIRPWQLLSGKIISTTIIGLTQVAAVGAAGLIGMRLAGQLNGLPDLNLPIVAVGIVCLLLAIMLSSSLMAGLAARVERQEDLNSVLQPAFAVVLLPLLAAVYGAFNFADSPWLDIASIAPGFNVYVLPVRMAIESVPLWQILLSLAIALATTAAAFAVAGRIYTGSVLRSGGRVALKESLKRQ